MPPQQGLIVRGESGLQGGLVDLNNLMLQQLMMKRSGAQLMMTPHLGLRTRMVVLPQMQTEMRQCAENNNVRGLRHHHLRGSVVDYQHLARLLLVGGDPVQHQGETGHAARDAEMSGL